MTYIDSAIQTSPANMDTILSDMQHVSGSLGEFLRDLFQHPHKSNKDKGPARSQRHIQMVLKFLQGRSGIKAEEIVDLIYNHPEAVPQYTSHFGRSAAFMRSAGVSQLNSRNSCPVQGYLISQIIKSML